MPWWSSRSSWIGERCDKSIASDGPDDDSELLEPEKVKGQPLCMRSYKYLYVHVLFFDHRGPVLM